MKGRYPGRVVVWWTFVIGLIYGGWVGFWLLVNFSCRISGDDVEEQVPGVLIYACPFGIAVLVGLACGVIYLGGRLTEWADEKRPEPVRDPERERLVAEAIRDIDEYLRKS